MGATVAHTQQPGTINVLFALAPTFSLSCCFFSCYISLPLTPPQNAGNSIPSLVCNTLELFSAVDLNGIAERIEPLLRMTRSLVLVPLLRFAVILCLVMTLMILLEKIYFGLVSLVVKIFRLKPEKRYRWEAIRPDLELGTLAYPKVLIQIPMFNEKEVGYDNV